MKKLICVLLVIISIFAFTGCHNNKGIDTNKISVGIIETRGNISKSRILFLDDQLKEIGSLPLDYANVGESFEKALVKDNILYVIPKGLDAKKDEKAVLEIDLKNLETKKHTINQIAMYGITVDDNNIYTANNINGSSYINKCNKKTDKTDTIELKNVYISNLFFADNKLFAFAELINDSNIRTSYIYVYDNNLKLMREIDITQCGASQNKFIEHKGHIYFSNMSDKYDNFGNTVGVLDTTDFSLDIIKLNQNCPLDLQIHNDKLYITHYNIIQGVGGGLTVYDLKNKEQNYIEFSHGAEQMSIANNKMYVLADRTLNIYDINTLKLVNSTEISNMDSDYSYLSGLFVV